MMKRSECMAGADAWALSMEDAFHPPEFGPDLRR